MILGGVVKHETRPPKVNSPQAVLQRCVEQACHNNHFSLDRKLSQK